MAEKKIDPKKKGVRIQNKQAWIDTIVYLCPHRERGGWCMAGGEPYTNCTGRGTYSTFGGACTHVKEYIDTYIDFVRGDKRL